MGNLFVWGPESEKNVYTQIELPSFERVWRRTNTWKETNWHMSLVLFKKGKVRATMCMNMMKKFKLVVDCPRKQTS